MLTDGPDYKSATVGSRLKTPDGRRVAANAAVGVGQKWRNELCSL